MSLGDDEQQIDHTIIAQIRLLEAVRPGLLRQLVELFFQNADRLFAEIDSNSGTLANEKLRMGFHSLKGTAASLGAARLSTVAAVAERAASGEAPVDAQSITALRTEYYASSIALAELAGLPAPQRS